MSLTLEQKKEIAQYVVDCRSDSLEFYSDKFKLFNYFDRLYIKGAAQRNTPRGRANLQLPYAFQQVEPFTCQMVETMCGEAPYIAYAPRQAEDEETAEDITEFTQYQLEIGDFLVAFTSFTRNVGKYGTGVMKVVWDVRESRYKDTRTVQKELYDEETEEPLVDPETGQILVEETEEEFLNTDEIEFDSLKFINISIFDFFVPKNASSIDVQNHDWNIHRAYRDLDDLLKDPNYKMGHKHLKEIKEGKKAEDRLKNEWEPNRDGQDEFKVNEQEQNHPGKGLKKFSGKIEVLEWWGDYELPGYDEKMPCLLVVAIVKGEPVLLRAEENPLKYQFKPFVACNDYPIQGEFYGYGELDHIQGMVEEGTALRNARLDVSNLSINRMWLVNRNAGLNLRNLYTAPNNIIMTNDINGIKPLDLGGVTSSSVEELARIDYDIQNTTEIINPRQDVSNVGAAFGSTATGVNFLSAKSNLRLLLKARLMEETFFRPLALMINKYNQDFVTDEMYFRAANKDNPYRRISPDAFATELDFRPTANPEKITNAQKMENMEYMLQVIGQMENSRGKPIAEEAEIIPEMFKMRGFANPERFLKKQQTVVIVTPDQQLLDENGQPVQVVPVDEQGNPVQQSAPPQAV